MSCLRINKVLFLVAVILTALIVSNVSAAGLTPCSGKLINPATDICWDCLLPITIGSNSIAPGSLPDTSNPDSPICVCPGHPIPHIGIALGYWEPMALVDVTRTPFCLVSLGGISVGAAPNAGDITAATTKENSSFFHVHEYNFPIMRWLGIEGNCHQRGPMMPEYLGELDPTWNDDTLAMTLFPETAAFGDPISQSACAVDAASASFGLPQDKLFWCAGSQGTLYPVTGQVEEHVGGVQATVLLTERLLFKLHRLGLVQDSSASHLCSESYEPIMPKSRYRYQMTYPVATTKSAGCQPFGRSTIPWEAIYSATQETPLSTENYSYLIWKKRNCCSY